MQSKFLSVLFASLCACQAAPTTPSAPVNIREVAATPPAESQLTLARVVERGGELAYRNPGSLPWIAGREYAVSDEQGLGAVQADTGERRVIATREDLIPSGQQEPLDVESWVISKDELRALLYTNTSRVWRLNTRGDYWVYELAGGALRQLGADFPESSMQFAKFSPDGTRVAYVQGHDLWVEERPAPNARGSPREARRR